VTGGVLTPWRSAVAAGLVTLALGAGTALGVAVPGPAAPTPSRAWIAAPLSPVVARAAPKASGKVVWRIPLVGRFGRDRTKLLVTRVTIRKGVRWAEVLLPKRPNGSRGWVLQDRMELTSTAIRVRIDVSDRRLSVFRENRRIMNVPVAVGQAGTPTPIGRWFAIAETLPGVSGGFLGTFILPITGFSETLNEFGGGDGRVAIHGTTLPQLIGTRASHGCVRMYNTDVTRLARLAIPGTPLVISP
jgi:lipoprotein-anchoring transpeptidase ErfK/SrfK